MKKTLIEVGVVVVGALVLGGLVLYKNNETKKEEALSMCPTDVMMCPDGSSVPRGGPNCEFGVCRQETPSYIVEEKIITATPTAPTPKTVSSTPAPKSFLGRVTQQVSSVIETVRETVSQNVSSGVKETSNGAANNNQQVTSNNNTATTPPRNSPVDETRYVANNGNVTDGNGNVIYTTPSSGGGSSGWVTHVVDVVPVNDVAPIVGAIPVKDLPGKYYLSESSFNPNGGCLFSNKIYILDTKTNTRTLMYEESNTTLGEEDPRACTSEIFLLATDNERLVLKYHTIGTNTVCETSWSEPEKTWYLDVTKPELGTKRYLIAAQLYADAESQEATCREKYETATSSQSEVNGG